MRLIRRTLFLAILAVGGVAAYNNLDHRFPLRPTATHAAEALGDRMSDSALTAKIKSKMALDDHVNARAINVDTSGSVVTLRGNVLSKAQRDRALRLARDTAGVRDVVDRLQVR